MTPPSNPRPTPDLIANFLTRGPVLALSTRARRRGWKEDPRSSRSVRLAGVMRARRRARRRRSLPRRGWRLGTFHARLLPRLGPRRGSLLADGRRAPGTIPLAVRPRLVGARSLLVKRLGRPAARHRSLDHATGRRHFRPRAPVLRGALALCGGRMGRRRRPLRRSISGASPPVFSGSRAGVEPLDRLTRLGCVVGASSSPVLPRRRTGNRAFLPP